MKAEILSWSRSRGVFAGLSLEVATLRQDEDENAKLYGKPLTNEEILTGTVKRTATAAPFLAQLQRFSGKGVPPAVVPAKAHQPIAPQNKKSDTASVSAQLPTIQPTTNPIMRGPGPRRISRGMVRAMFN